MMKKTKTLRNLAIAFAIIFGLNFIFGNTLPIYAADISDDATSSNDDTSSDDGTAEVEKKLVQYSNDWVILQYDDENGDPTQFDITYMGKTPEELEAEGIKIQYRPIWKNDIYGQLFWYSWYNLGEPITDNASDIYDDGTINYLIEFRAVNMNSTNPEKQEDILSISDSFVLYDTQKPYIMSSTPYCYEDYDLRILSNSITFTLKINQQLKQIDDSLSVSVSTKVDSWILEDYSASNLSFENHAETYLIDEKVYSLEYCTITFDAKLSSIFDETYSYETYYDYFFTFDCLQGIDSNLPISTFILSVCTPTNASPEDILVETISIDPPSATVPAGSTIHLTATILPENATYPYITWHSTNDDYATVDENGVVTAKSAGIGNTVIISAVAEDEGNVDGTCTLLITQSEKINVQSIQINSSSSVQAGKSIQLSANVLPENATDKTITWSSSNTDYATVDANGLVTTKAEGAGQNVTITASANDGSGVTGSYTLSIIKPNQSTDPSVPSKPSDPTEPEQSTKPYNPTQSTPNTKVTSIKIAGNTSVKAGGKVTLKATVSPANATNKSLTWSSSNTKYATVNANGVVITKKAGAGKTVTITATAKDGSGKKATFKIKIQKIKVTSIKLKASKSVKAGKKLTIKATVKPSNATSKVLSWTSSKKKYATVNSKGVVSAKKAGKGKTVTITAKAKDGSGKKATIKIKIK